MLESSSLGVFKTGEGNKETRRKGAALEEKVGQMVLWSAEALGDERRSLT